MNFVTIKRVIQYGLTNFWRNRWLSLASALVLSLTLITISISVIQYIDIQRTIDSIKDRLDMTVFFDDKVTEPEIQDIQLKLQSRPEIKSVTYVPKDEAFKRWQQLPTTQKVKDLVTPDDNPLSRSLQIKTNDPESLESVAALLEAPSLKDKIRGVSYKDNKKIIQDFIQKNKTIRETGLISSMAFVVISLIVIVNTIRTIILSRKEEFEIMRLVGASDLFVRAPILVESILTGIIAATLSTAFVVGGIVFELPIIPFFISNYFGEFSDSINVLIKDRIVVIYLAQLAVAFLLTVTTTYLSLRRYLKG